MSNVIRFPSVITDDEAMRLEMVEALQYMLGMAEKGELKALLLTSIATPEDVDGEKIESWVFDGAYTPTLAGAAGWAVQRLYLRMEYSDDE
jgi:hypothetical protein